MYELFTKREVKMARYWLSFFFCMRFYGPRQNRGPQEKKIN